MQKTNIYKEGEKDWSQLSRQTDQAGKKLMDEENRRAEDGWGKIVDQEEQRTKKEEEWTGGWYR